MADSRIQLAYDASVANLTSQDGTLGNIRTRASALFSAAAVTTTFAAAVGLLNTDPDEGKTLPVWAAWILLTIVVLIGALVMYILMPVKDWNYGPSGKAILDLVDTRTLNEDAIRREAIDGLADAIEQNRRILLHRVYCYQSGILLLGVEVAVFVVAAAL